MGRPYSERMISENVIIREFSDDVPVHELEWHMDRKDRIVEVLDGRGWKLQLQEGLPFDIIPGNKYAIPKESWHRVLRGDETLRILIREL